MRLLTIKDLAVELQVKPSTLYAWVAERKIPFVKLNGLIRFRREAIQEWVESRGRGSVSTGRVLQRRRMGEGIDEVIARAKHAVYTPGCGKPDQDRAEGKEVADGSV